MNPLKKKTWPKVTDMNVSLDDVNEVICVALNYITHVEEVESAFRKAPYKSPPATPVLFIKPHNTLTSHMAPVLFPTGVEEIQAGPSLAIVIGKKCCRVSEAEAMDYIHGYTVFNDISLPEESYFRPAITSKCYDSFGPLGPGIVAREEIEDPHDLHIRTFVNGELKQEGHTDEMIWSVPSIIEFISSFKTLMPGEVIATGFPAGRVSLKAGDEVSVEIDKIGLLGNRVVSEKEFYQA